jgi:hypothetical protein
MGSLPLPGVLGPIQPGHANEAMFRNVTKAPREVAGILANWLREAGARIVDVFPRAPEASTADVFWESHVLDVWSVTFDLNGTPVMYSAFDYGLADDPRIIVAIADGLPGDEPGDEPESA